MQVTSYNSHTHEFSCSAPSRKREREGEREREKEREGGLKLPNLRHDRWRHGRHIGLLPHLVAGLGCMVTTAVKDFSTCMPLSQEDPEIST